MRSICASSRCLASASITGPIWVAGSAGSPMTSSRAAPAIISIMRSATSACMHNTRTAEQRGRAERLLFAQDDVADRMIEMIAGAARELVIGDPADPSTHVGPVIDAEAKQKLEAHIETMKQQAKLHFAGHAPSGNFVAPHIFELREAGQLTEEV